MRARCTPEPPADKLSAKFFDIKENTKNQMLKLLKKLKPLEWLMLVVIVAVVGVQVYFDLALPDKMGDLISLIQYGHLDVKVMGEIFEVIKGADIPVESLQSLSALLQDGNMPDFVAGLAGVLPAETFGSVTSLLATLDTTPITTGDIWLKGLDMLLVVLASAACTVFAGYLIAGVAARLSKTLRHDVFVKVNEFSMEEMTKFSTSSLITRTTNDIVQVQQIVVMLRMVISAPITAVGAILKITSKSMQLSLVTAVAIGAMFALMLFMFFVVFPKFNIMQKLTDKLNLVSRENLTGLRVVRAYNAEGIEQEKFEKANEDITKTNLFVNRVSSIMMPGMQLIISGLSLGISWIGAYLIADNLLEFADMAVFMQYSMQVLMSFMMLSMLFVMVPRASVSAKRINEVLNTKVKIADGGFKGETEQKGTVEFRDVNFKYPDADGYVLKNINLKVNKGETVAFIGSTGSGKSTLINLVARLYDATEGEVLVDGYNVKDYNLNTLYSKIGYVPQKGMLFSGTVAENVTYGKPNASGEDIMEAINIAQAADFVNTLSEGTAYHIAQGGQNVSGGQKQRLSIARAIIKKPEIYIFDDSFSALDYRTDKALRAALKKEVQGATSLIVAQRIGTIMDADKIVVLDQGDIIDIGNHRELLERCSVYQEIAYSQLSKEELE